MRRHFSRLALSLGALAATAPMALAQVNPRANSVTEDAVFQQLQQGQTVSGRVTIPDAGAGILIDPSGREWAGLHTGTMQWLTIIAIVGMLVILLAFFLIRGRIRIDSGLSGRKILRFNGVERFAHWMLAVTFIILALTGINLILGRELLLPLIGERAFGTLTIWGKIAHNYLSWPFMAALVLIFVLWVARNLPRRHDWQWLKQGGGLFSKNSHPPAGKFNAGQKLIFWAVIIGGALLSWSGIMLLFPTTTDPASWQFFQVMHAVVAAIMIAIILAHIYLGSVGMEGAFAAMGSGEVDENWAREHHALWVEEKRARDAKKAAKSGTPAEAPAAARPAAPATPSGPRPTPAE
jgi:formate dehydrogenase subunit gamma